VSRGEQRRRDNGMVAQQVGPLWTVEGYLDMERRSTIKHEYHDGYVYAMSGSTQAHSQIVGNVYTLLRTAVRGSDCRVLDSNIRVRQSADDYVYTDGVVTCDPRDRVFGRDWIDYPTLVVEVLSPSTERYDRGKKFEEYKAIPTVREYVLVEQRRREVEVRGRDAAGTWTSTTYGPADDVVLHSVALTLPMGLVYEDSGV